MPSIGGTLGGAAGGAGALSMFGPIGMGIGAIGGGIKSLFGGKKKPPVSPIAGNQQGNPLDPTNIGNQYQEFANTGGYSEQDKSNIRSRALSPTRAVYANAQRNVNRQRALQGGYSPGFGALQARMAREQSQGMSDASTNAEAGLAEMVQKGRLQGLAGMSNLYQTDQTAPSDYQRKLSSIGGTAGLIGNIGSSIMAGFGGGGGGIKKPGTNPLSPSQMFGGGMLGI